MRSRHDRRAPPSGTGCISVDGCLFAPEHARVSALDVGLLLGDGLFESLRAEAGVPYLLERHLERLLGAAEELFFNELPDRCELAAQVWHTLEHAALDHAYVRITLTRGVSALALGAPSGRPTVLVAALPAPATVGERLRVALIGAESRSASVAAKSTSRQPAVLARIEVERGGAQEGLRVCSQGNVLEGISSNVFVSLDGALHTPPTAECLAGVTRGRLLELAREAGVAVFERPLALETLLAADGAFLTNAVRGLRAIEQIDGRAFGADQHDELFTMLANLYRADRAAVATSVPATLGDARQ